MEASLEEQPKVDMVIALDDGSLKTAGECGRANNLHGAVVCMALQLFSCGKKLAAGEEKIHVGLTYYNQSDTFLNQLIVCFRESLEEMEGEGSQITLTVRDAAGSQRTQDDQVKVWLLCPAGGWKILNSRMRNMFI